ncbi:hypothetical protein [Mesorhizobium sp. M1273]|uniref:hypothetical protein n=1 Tax=Mesorhizobium sp. M1273 TaxID=2957075 RepID=UPI00333AE677
MSERTNEASDAKSSSFFRPESDTPEYFEGAGKRKDHARVESRPVRWPNNRIEAMKQFEVWHTVAMQIANAAGCSFRTLGVFFKFVNWSTGTLWPMDETLAEHAGNCSPKTVSRDLGAYKAAGIIDVKSVYDPKEKRKRRVIRLTYPVRLPDGIILTEDVDQMDTGGPFGEHDQMDTGGPYLTDTGGPNTFDSTAEGKPS